MLASLTDDELAWWHDQHIGTIHVPDDLDKATWVDGDAPESFGRGDGTYDRLHPRHAFIIDDVDAVADEITVRDPWNPTAGAVVLTMGELQLSSDNVDVNEVP